MAYIDPSTVDSPRKSWRLTEVLYNAKSFGWSVAKGEWEGESTIGIRWNGSTETEGVGNPQSRGKPTWFIVPQEFHEAMDDVIKTLKDKEIQTRLFQPEGYAHGIFRIEIFLSEKTLKELSEYMKIILHFSIPKIADANIIPEADYRAYLPKENCLGGKFSEDGRWVGDIYMHPDKYDKDFLNNIESAILGNIQKALSGYLDKPE